MPAAEFTHSANKAVDILSTLPSDAVTELCLHILTYLCGQSAGVDSAALSIDLSNAGITLDHEELQSITRCILLTFRYAGKHGLSADGLVSLLEKDCSRWRKPCLQVIHKLWSEHSAQVQLQEAKGMLIAGQLVDMQWKLGMAVSSDTCRSLNSPYVTLMLKTVNSTGQICQKTFEMTIQQFQNLHSHIKDIATVMETV